MLTLIYGGSGCGKSAYAEKLAVQSGGPLSYIATMQPFGMTAQKRIEKHRAQREGKGFRTIEWYTGLDKLKMPRQKTILLECMGNLVANELFSPDGAGKDAVERILKGIANLERQTEKLIVVSNDVFKDGLDYPEETQIYLNFLGAINRMLAQRAEQVFEIVCGIPLTIKGEVL